MNTTITLKQKLLGSSQLSCWKFATCCNFLKLGTGSLFVLFLLFALVLIPTKSFSQITAGFELEGNAQAVAPNPPDDWDLIFNNTSSAQVTTGIVNDLSGNSDNIFTIGSKDQDNVSDWHWTIQSVPDKDEILHAGAALYGGTKIYFFGDRFAQNGDAQIGFWLFKNAVSTNPDGTFNGTHAIGDILLLSNFSNGGGVVTIVAYEWVGSGGSEGTLNQIPVTGSALFAITNSSVSPSPWPYTPKMGPAGSFPVGAFFEGGIDLAGLGFGIDPCFTSFLMETRSSTSITAELKDFVFGSFFTKPQVTVNNATRCINGNPAVLTASVQGGVQPPTYAWSPGGATTPSISVSPSVTTVYTVVVTAANGCVSNPATGTITVNPLPACSIGDPNPPLGVVKCKVSAGAPGNTNTISTTTNLDPNLYTLAWSITPSQTVMTGWSITSGQGSNSITFQSGLCGTAGASVAISLTVTEKATGCVSTCNKIIVPQAPQCIADVLPHGSLDCIITTVTITGVGSSDNPPPTILWTAGNGGNILSGANTLTIVVDAPGNYTLTVTDPIDGCSVSATTTVTEDITVPVLTETHTAVSCFGLSDGAIDLSVSGGKSPYTYLWSTGATTEDISGLVAGSYTVTVTGANGCTATKVIPITQPPVLVLNTQKVDVLCNGESTGSITASASGGTAPYQFSINAGAFSANNVFSNLAAGTYTIHAKDANGCEKTAIVTITQPALAVLNTQKVDVLCNGESTGSITASGSGGVAPYQFSINAGAFSANNVFSNLAAGTYTIHLKDANGCEKTAVVTITQPALAVLNTQKVNVLCNGESTGSITASGSGGVAPYQFSINAGAFSANNVFSNLAAGTYTIHLKDANGCEKTAVVTITQPALAVLNTQKVDVLCNGESTGSITASGSGGVAPYQFSINAGAFSSNNVFSNLAAGTYTIHLKDANGCEKTAVVTITQPALAVLNTQKVDVLCNGESTGSITASGSGGVAPYQFSINAGAFSANNVFSNLAAGTYTIHLKDANGCEKTAVVTITQPTLVVLSTQKTDVPCNGESNGSITASASGGTAPYQFSINAGAFSSNNVFSNLAAGTYTIHVKDANNCEKTTVVTITQTSLVVLSTQKVDVLCFGESTGSITASASGGTAPYQFSINAGAFSANNVFSNLAIGTYTIHVKDANDCEKTAVVIITQPTLAVLNTQKVDVLCNGESTGSITASGSGGVAPYQFSINAGAFSANNVFSNLAAGSYTIHLKDANGCEKTAVVTITQPALAVLNTQKVDVLCNGESTGSITASGSGGVAPYQFSINAGAFSANNVFSNLAAGTYTIHLKDANGCEKTAVVIITQPTLAVLNTQKVDVLCNGESTGSITTSGSGGVAPYQFSINAGAFSANNVFSNLAAGTYTIHLKDANGCEKTAVVTITQPALAVLNTQKVDVLCNGESTGSITASGSGGVAPYQFSINAGAFSANNVFSNLAAGTYTIHLKDANGCEKTAVVTITQPALAVLNTQKVDVLCFGEDNGSITASASGGVAPYQFSINAGAFSSNNVFSGLVAGTYTIHLKDANGCEKTAVVTITQPTLVVLSTQKVDVLCFEESTGSITASGSGGVAPYLFSINAGAFSSNNVFSNLGAGTYTIHVKDAQGCEKTAVVTITQPTLVVLSTQKTDVLCFEESTGSITASASGGVAPYQFSINAGAFSSNNVFSGLTAGTYTIHVKDANGCEKTAVVTITQPTLVVLSTQKVDVLCFGGSTGSITASASGGTAPYQFSINAGAFSSNNVFSNLAAGTYTIHVKDANGCEKTAVVTLTQPPAVSCLLVAPDPLPVCGSTGNVLTATVANATSYLWSVMGDNGWAITAGQGTPSIIYTAGQDSAIFKLVVTNSNGCKDSCMVTVKIGSCVKVKSICTLTQGFWGNPNGVACATGERSAVLVRRLLGAPFGDLVIGKPGRSLTITQDKSQCVTLRMPGGGPAALLPAVDQSFGANCVTTIPLNNQGRFNNTLLGQTIALGLNLRLDSDLGSVVLSNSFGTMGAKPGADGLCGTDDDVPDFTSAKNISISQVVLDALNSLYSSPTVANLFDLANRALGGKSTGGATLRDINEAVSAINEGFDHCRFTEISPNIAIGSGLINTDLTQDIVMKAFPNPFANSTTIEFMAKTDGNVTVNVYTLAGVRVAELFNGPLKADESKQVIFNGTNLPNGIYIYKITVDDKLFFDKLILQK